MFVSDLFDSIHPGRVPKKMDRDDSPSLTRDTLLYELRIEVPGNRLRVDRDRDQIVMNDGESCGDIRGSAQYHFAPGGKPQSWQRQVKSRGTAGHCYSMPAANSR